MSVSLWQDRSENNHKIFDVVIIGGGIAGLSTAYWLSKQDTSLKIALVEKYELASGATGRNAGFITCGSVEHFNRLVEKHGAKEAEEIWKFSEENLRLLKEHIIQGSEKELLFENKGSFSLASSHSEFTELKKSAGLMESFGIKVETLEEAAIQTRLSAEGFVGGIKYIDDASVHPVRMLRKMVEKLGDKVTILENNEVYAVEKVGESRLVKTQKGHYEAAMVVYATNGYSPLLHKYFGDKIFPTRGQILATAPVEKFMEGPCYANFVLDYFRQLPTGQVVIGGFRQLQKDVEVGYSDEITEVIQSALEEFLATHLPKMKGAAITHRWSGIMGFSIDGNPIVGSLPEDPQSFFVGGFTAHGLGLAFHSGKMLADLVFGNAIPKFISAKRLH